MMLQKQPAMTYSINEEPTGKLALLGNSELV